MKIPADILQAIESGTVEGYENGRYAMMAWGSSNLVGHNEFDNYGQGWLKFKVNSTYFSGWVRCALNSKNNIDLSLESFSNRTGEYGMLRQIRDIPKDKLAETIDMLL